jgi:hypothetical protein
MTAAGGVVHSRLMSLRSELLALDRGAFLREREMLARDQIAVDRLSLRKVDVDGRLHVDVCNISKATVNSYWGYEIPNSATLGLNPRQLYRLYRDPDELAKAVPSFRNLQLLDLHTLVDASNPKMDRTCGCVGSDVRFEAPYLKASLAVWTRAAIDRIKSRQSAQLSCSYRYRADMTPGVTPGGLVYDGVMRDIMGNHVALVREGRAGPDVCVSDSLPAGLSRMKFPSILAAIHAAVPTLTAEQQMAVDSALALAVDRKAKDAEYEREEAMDCREEAMDSREETIDAKEAAADESEKDEVAKGDRKRARDARKAARDKRAADRKMGKDRRAADKAARDTDPTLAPLEAELKGRHHPVGAITGADAIDAALKAGTVVSAADAKRMADDAADKAVARVNAIAQAREDVKPLVGIVTAAMDSAEAVYRFALDQVKVATPKDAPATALAAIVAAEVRARKTGGKPELASDSKPVAGHTLASVFKPAQ